MYIAGSIDQKNQLWVELTIYGGNGEKTIKALLDTGFTGELLLPLKIAVPLSLKLAGASDCQLADGSISNQTVFYAKVKWGTSEKDVTVNVVDVEHPLIGGGLLHGYTLIADFEKRMLIIKEPRVDEPSTGGE